MKAFKMRHINDSISREFKENPISFSDLMVRSILEGRKSQTRWIIHPKPESVEWSELKQAWVGDYSDRCSKYKYINPLVAISCPYGEVGDRLWVAESIFIDDVRCHGSQPINWPLNVEIGPIYYRSDRECCQQTSECQCASTSGFSWIPDTHMPRWASRITLEITGLRVEKLNQISEADAIAEGVEHDCYIDPHDSFFKLWESTNGPGSLAENPWVFVIEFRRVE